MHKPALISYIEHYLEKLPISDREKRSEARLILSYTKDKDKIDKILKRRLKREPIQYILGLTYFYDIELIVGKGVLIPRFDTEVLVDVALELIGKKTAKVLDLACGSGAIGLSILNNTEKTTVDFADISKRALVYTRKNIKKLGFEARSCILHSDMFKNIHGHYDLIVCNPPYIEDEELDSLDAEVKDYEPKLALVNTKNYYGVLGAELWKYLSSGGFAIVELNANKWQDNIKNFSRYNCEIREDLTGNKRLAILSNKI